MKKKLHIELLEIERHFQDKKQLIDSKHFGAILHLEFTKKDQINSVAVCLLADKTFYLNFFDLEYETGTIKKQDSKKNVWLETLPEVITWITWEIDASKKVDRKKRR